MRLGQRELAERFPKTSVVKGCNATLRRILLKYPDVFHRQENDVKLAPGYNSEGQGASRPVADPAVIAKVLPQGAINPRATRLGDASHPNSLSNGGAETGGGVGAGKPRMIKPKAIPGLPSNRKPSVSALQKAGDTDDVSVAAPRRRRQNAKRLKREAKERGITVEQLKEEEVRWRAVGARGYARARNSA